MGPAADSAAIAGSDSSICNTSAYFYGSEGFARIESSDTKYLRNPY